jgi:histidine kinase
MNRFRRLDVRLFVSYAIVVVVVVAALGVTFALRATSSFDERIRGAGESGRTEAESHRAFVDSIWSAVPIALGVSVGAAGLVTLVVARRILRPIDDVRRATRRLAAGHYDERVHAPGELELAGLASDVNLLAQALETTERKRAELISEVAHEMRTPLTTITGYVEGMLDGVFEPSDEILGAVVDETARLERLASDLSTLSRAEERSLVLHLTREDLGDLAELTAARLGSQFDGKGVRLEVRAAPPLPVVVDRDRIIQVLTNLLGNALTYTGAGGQVTVSGERRGSTVALSVHDTGAGIAAEDLDLVFERFYRVPGLPRPPSGSGIGLTIARGIARAHGGDVTVASPGLGEGSTFSLQLNLDDGGQPPELPAR